MASEYLTLKITAASREAREQAIRELARVFTLRPPRRVDAIDGWIAFVDATVEVEEGDA